MRKKPEKRKISNFIDKNSFFEVYKQCVVFFITLRGDKEHGALA